MRESHVIGERGERMWTKWYSKVGIVCVMAACAALCNANRASGQLAQEPRIEGVSYSEIAQWQQTYGRGPFLRGGYGPGFCQLPPVVEYCETDDAPVVVKPQGKKRSQSN